MIRGLGALAGAIATIELARSGGRGSGKEPGKPPRRRSFLRRALRGSMKAAGVLVLILVVLVLLLLFKTSLVLNTRTASFALRKFGKSYSPRWEELSLKVRGVRSKRIVFHAKDLCLDEKDGALAACFPILDVDATIRLGFDPLVSIRRIETLRVRSSTLRSDSTKAPKPAPKKAKKKSKPHGMSELEPVAHLTLGTIDVDIPKAEMISSSGTTTLKIRAAFDSKTSSPLAADVFATVPSSGGSHQNYEAHVSLDSDLFRKGTLTQLDAKARVKGSQLLARLDAALKPESDRLALRLTGSVKTATQQAEVRVDGAKQARLYSGRGTVSVGQTVGALQRAALRDCEFKAPLDSKQRVEHASLVCGLDVRPRLFGAKSARLKRFGGRLAADVDFKGRKKDKFEAKLESDLRPAEKNARAIARLNARLAGDKNALPQSLKAGHEFEATLTIERFEDIVSVLKGTDWAVPAPLNAMNGPITLEARMEGKGRSPDLTYHAATGLAGGRQSLKIEARGVAHLKDAFEADRKISDRTEVDLRDVAIELPNLEIGKVPAPAVDTRIKTGQPARDAAVERKRQQAAAPAKTDSSVDYNAHVFTAQPIRIFTNLAEDPVPIALDLHAVPAGLTGTIQIQSFRMKVFKQEGRIDHITIAAAPGSGSMTLDGKVVYKKQDVTVNILLLGSTSKPKVTFESDPPMSQQEIVGLLLFDKSPAEMDSDEQASASNASAAMQSGALGLASLYLFASTPIQSVGYDPNTSTYQIRFKLPGGATLAVGSNLQESQTLGLRKRLNKHLEVETELLHQNTQGNAITTFLDWFTRY